MELELNRRSFVAAGTLAASGIAFAEATASEMLAPQTALAEEAAQDGGADVGPIAPVDVPASWDFEADVVVVGAGGGGLNAAARCAELGASVILIEKTAVFGGNTANAGGSIIMGGSKYTDEAEGALPEWPFDPMKWLDWKMEAHHDALNPQMQLAIAANMGPAHDWMGKCGVPWYVVWGNTLIPATGSRDVAAAKQSVVTKQMHDYGESLGVDFHANTPAQALVRDEEGRIVGVQALDENEDVIYLHATRAVIMCAGGFAANKDMLRAYCPTGLQNANNCYVAQCDSGECIRMGLGVGATLVDNDSYAMFDGGLPYERYGGEWCTYLYNGATQLARQPWLTIDKTGARKRYISTSDQLGMTGGALTRQANVQTATPGHRSYIFFDANYETSVQSFSEHHCRTPITPDMDRVAEFVPEHYCDWRNGVNDAIESGVIAHADTLTELAEKLGLDAEVVEQAVADWNDVCARGEDDFTYPYNPEWLIPITEPPFYGAEVGGIIFRTNTGLAINTNMQVLDGEGLPIPGLYAGWFTAAGACADGSATSIKYAGEGISLSYTGGYMCANSVMGQK